VRLARGRTLGYRRSAGADVGTWYARLYVGAANDASPYRKRALGSADDAAQADGAEVLSYGQAVEQTLAWEPGAESASIAAESLTVADVVAHYLEWYEGHRTHGGFLQARSTLTTHALPRLGEILVVALTAPMLRRWHEAVAKSPARLRGGRTRPARTEDEIRARKVTANRALAMLKAALNRAVEDGLTEAGAWRKVRPFRGVETARVRYLEAEELRRLLNACEPDFRAMVAAAVHTGARYAELAGLEVGDYKPEAQAMHFRKTKIGAARYVFLSDEAQAFFDALTAARPARDHLLTRADGDPWGAMHQRRRIQNACKVAGIEPPLRFHELRHSYASLYLMNGGSLVALAKQLGHTSTRMVEKHYGHLADTWRAEEARKHAPRLGMKTGKVARMQGRRP
jgi:integrase